VCQAKNLEAECVPSREIRWLARPPVRSFAAARRAPCTPTPDFAGALAGAGLLWPRRGSPTALAVSPSVAILPTQPDETDSMQPPPQLTAAEFNAALKQAGFGVEHARIIDVSGRCPGFVTTPAFRGRALDRPRTLAKAIRERDDEIARRGARPRP
jgi:hypothetical protein